MPAGRFMLSNLLQCVGEKKGVGSTLGDHAYRLTTSDKKANAEQYAREQADLAIDSKITVEATTRGQQVQSVVNDLASEVATRQADVFQVQTDRTKKKMLVKLRMVFIRNIFLTWRLSWHLKPQPVHLKTASSLLVLTMKLIVLL